jgi:4-amino-4-deoxy-L-arabinose transferase-like glycosyltransferase
MLPTVLAHAGLATTDMALTAAVGVAFFSLILWAESPSWKHTLLLGFTTALAVLSKFTALGYLPAAAVLALLFYIVAERPGVSRLAGLAKARAAKFAAAGLTCAVVIWAAYWFSFGKVPVWNVTLPAPEFFDGIREALFHNQVGHPAYLLGQASQKGWWYFFPVALAVKTPIASLLLLGLGLSVCWKNRATLTYTLPLALSLGILLPAMAGNVNIGLRHILPVYIGFSIIGGLGLLQLLTAQKPWASATAVLLVLWMAASGARSHPNYIAYFNEFAAAEPDRVLVDSDYDWGQDTVQLARRLRELGVREIAYTPLNNADDAYLEAYPGLPHIKPINPLAPSEGWTAVRPTYAKADQYGLEYRYPNLKPWFEYLQPRERVGAFLLYYVPPGSLPAPR